MIKLITHNDLDGIGCHVVAKYFLEEEIDVDYCTYKNVNEVVLEVIEKHEQYDKIFITDISVNEEIAKRLDEIKNKVGLFDHHPTALFLNEYDWASVEIECEKGKTCGTKMIFDFLRRDNINPSICYFVELVRKYDTWEWKDKYDDEIPKQLNDLMYMIGRKEFVDDMIYKTKSNEVLFDSLYCKLLELKQREIDNYIKQKDKNLIIKDILGYNAGIVFAESHTSELGNKLSELHPELDFIAMINQETISYRTIKDDVNLSEVSKCFGGGGHPKASGSQVSRYCVDKFIEDIFKIR
ncbi:oligoribonuclease NrnB [Paraclostridium bifermentans]